MPAPSKNFTTIADSSVDGSSPLDTTIVTALRDNGIHDRECIYDPALHTAAKAHEHTGVDSAKVKEANLDRSGGPRVFDDFLGEAVSSFWDAANATILSSENNGKVQLAASGRLTNATNRPFKLSGNVLTFETLIQVVSGANSFYIGLCAGTAPGSNAILFMLNGTANWWALTQASATNTWTDTGIAWNSASNRKLKIVASPSSVAFYIDDVLKATHTTNIPTVNMNILLATLAGDSMKIDYVDCASNARV